MSLHLKDHIASNCFNVEELKRFLHSAPRSLMIIMIIILLLMYNFVLMVTGSWWHFCYNRQVEEGGCAFLAGVQDGDEVVSLNGEPCADLTLLQALALIDASIGCVQLLLKRWDFLPHSLNLMTTKWLPKKMCKSQCSAPAGTPEYMHDTSKPCMKWWNVIAPLH